MKKVLIWDARIPLKNCGGPSGYLFQIKVQLLDEPNDQIYFLSDYLPIIEEPLSDKYKTVSNISNFSNFFRVIRHIFSVYRLTHHPFPKELLDNINLNEFTHIHFHVSLDYYNARHLLRKYQGVIILTSHSPEPISSEIVNKWFPKVNFISKLSRKSIKKAENWAFCHAGKILFPVEEAVESYSKDEVFNDILRKRKSDLIYCPTAILPKILDVNYIDNLRQYYDIPQEAFLISYVGRHNAIKGYDILQQIALKILNKYPNAYFIIAGGKGPISELKHERWIEVGWTDKANEIISASDMFILPNRDTYFDLVALEVLRTGTPMLMSLTGGNRYFKNKYPNHSGLKFFNINNLDTAIIAIEDFQNDKNNKDYWDNLRLSNIKLWKSDFTLNKYISNYLKVI